jgi:cold shock protein
LKTRSNNRESLPLRSDAKGFVLITSYDGGEELFAHFSEVQVKGCKSLQENQKVSFDVKQGPTGKQAAKHTAHLTPQRTRCRVATAHHGTSHRTRPRKWFDLSPLTGTSVGSRAASLPLTGSTVEMA